MSAKSSSKKSTPRRRGSKSRPSEARVAVVTGGSRGIGKAIASELALRGYTVVITAREESVLAEASAELGAHGATVLTRACDVGNPESVARLFLALQTKFRHIDVLVNNAGVGGPNATIDKLSLEAWQEILATNLTGVFLVTKAALPLLRSGSTVVNNLSVAAKQIFPGMAAYIASKHGALGFSNALREELRPHGVRVLNLLAGATATDIWDQFWPEAPRGRMMTAETVAKAVVNAIEVPENAAVDELTITPATGAL